MSRNTRRARAAARSFIAVAIAAMLPLAAYAQEAAPPESQAAVQAETQVTSLSAPQADSQEAAPPDSQEASPQAETQVTDDAGDADDAYAETLREQGLGLSIDAESIKGGRPAANTDLRIGDYGFFAPESENRYAAAAEQSKAKAEAERELPFTPDFPAQAEEKSGAERIQASNIFAKPKEYNQGLYDESGASGNTLLLVCIFAGLCACTFFITRAWCKYRRRKAEKCISPSP